MHSPHSYITFQDLAPLRSAIGMMEWWNIGIMDFGTLEEWKIGICRMVGWGFPIINNL